MQASGGIVWEVGRTKPVFIAAGVVVVVFVGCAPVLVELGGGGRGGFVTSFCLIGWRLSLFGVGRSGWFVGV